MIPKFRNLFRPTPKQAATVLREHAHLSERERVRAVTAEMRRCLKLKKWEGRRG